MSNVEVLNGQTTTATGDKCGNPSGLSFDADKYRTEVDQFDITEAQKQELLLTLWSIMRSFVELGFTTDVCGALLRDMPLIPDDQELR